MTAKTSAERQAEYRERKAREEYEAGEIEEQRIRDDLGYAPSEKRSQAERQATADRMLGLETIPADSEINKMYDLGFAGEPYPHEFTPGDRLATAWSQGVWHRQAEQLKSTGRHGVDEKTVGSKEGGKRGSFR